MEEINPNEILPLCTSPDLLCGLPCNLLDLAHSCERCGRRETETLAAIYCFPVAPSTPVQRLVQPLRKKIDRLRKRHTASPRQIRLFKGALNRIRKNTYEPPRRPRPRR